MAIGISQSTSARLLFANERHRKSTDPAADNYDKALALSVKEHHFSWISAAGVTGYVRLKTGWYHELGLTDSCRRDDVDQMSVIHSPAPFPPVFAKYITSRGDFHLCRAQELCVRVEVAVLGSRPKEPYGFRGRKAILNHASALVSACPFNMSTDI